MRVNILTDAYRTGCVQIQTNGYYMELPSFFASRHILLNHFLVLRGYAFVTQISDGKGEAVWDKQHLN